MLYIQLWERQSHQLPFGEHFLHNRSWTRLCTYMIFHLSKSPRRWVLIVFPFYRWRNGDPETPGLHVEGYIKSKWQVSGLKPSCANPQPFGHDAFGYIPKFTFFQVRGGNFSLKNVSVEEIMLRAQPFSPEEGILEGSLSHLITKLKARGALLMLFCLCSWCGPNKHDVSWEAALGCDWEGRGTGQLHVCVTSAARQKPRSWFNALLGAILKFLRSLSLNLWCLKGQWNMAWW